MSPSASPTPTPTPDLAEAAKHLLAQGSDAEVLSVLGSTLLRLFDAEIAFGAVVESPGGGPDGGLRPRFEACASGPSRHLTRAIAQFEIQRGLNPIARELLRQPFEPVLAARRTDLIGHDHWQDSYMLWDAHVRAGVDDVMVAVVRARAGVGATMVAVLRRRGAEAFTIAECGLFKVFILSTRDRVDRALRQVPDLPGPGSLVAEVDDARSRWASGLKSLGEPSRQVLWQLVKGLSEREIAARVHRSPHTVHSHVRRIYVAMAVTSRVELVRLHGMAQGNYPATH